MDEIGVILWSHDDSIGSSAMLAGMRMVHRCEAESDINIGIFKQVEVRCVTGGGMTSSHGQICS